MGNAIIWGKTMIDHITVRGTDFVLPGGSGYYASLSAAHFSRAYLVSKTGSDFPRSDLEMLRAKGVDLAHLEILSGKCNIWRADCEDPSSHKTIEFQINTVIEHEKISAPLPPAEFAFIAEDDPGTQLKMIGQFQPGTTVMIDTKKRWAIGAPEQLKTAIRNATIAMMNIEEAILLFGSMPAVALLHSIKDLGVRIAILNMAGSGSIMDNGRSRFSIPALNRSPIDTLGGGDSFAGGFIGALAEGKSPESAFIYGQVMSSFVVEDYGPQRLFFLSKEEISDRYLTAQKLVR